MITIVSDTEKLEILNFISIKLSECNTVTEKIKCYCYVQPFLSNSEFQSLILSTKFETIPEDKWLSRLNLISKKYFSLFQADTLDFIPELTPQNIRQFREFLESY